MTFPVYIHLFGLTIHPHLFFESIGYFLGFQLYLLLRRREHNQGENSVSLDQNLWILVGCIAGAYLGSKVLAWIESAPVYWPQRGDPAVWLGPKTIVGGLIGGWIGIELAKKRMGIRRTVGDVAVFPVMLGMAIGRLGCFFTGLADQTYGLATRLPWAVNFGDGIPRHPTQLYDIVFLILFAAMLWLGRRRIHAAGNGMMFRLFMLGYCGYRFLIEFLKPSWKPYLGLSAIQVACLATVAFVAIFSIPRVIRHGRAGKVAAGTTDSPSAAIGAVAASSGV